MLGRSNTECGGIFGLTEATVRQDIREKMQTHISSIQDAYYKDKKTIEQIKEFNHLDEVTTWAFILKDKTDLERFELFMGNKK